MQRFACPAIAGATAPTRSWVLRCPSKKGSGAKGGINTWHTCAVVDVDNGGDHTVALAQRILRRSSNPGTSAPSTTKKKRGHSPALSATATGTAASATGASKAGCAESCAVFGRSPGKARTTESHVMGRALFGVKRGCKRTKTQQSTVNRHGCTLISVSQTNNNTRYTTDSNSTAAVHCKLQLQSDPGPARPGPG